MNKNVSSRFIIFSTIALSMCLSVAPFGNGLSLAAPQWVLLTLLYWSISAPNKVSIGTSWVTGIFFDVLTNASIGHNALVFSLAAYVGVIVYYRIKHYPIWLQTCYIFVFLFIIQLINIFLIKMTTGLSHSGLYWLPVLTSALCWPLLYSSLKNTQHSFNTL
jgi:rod shape-determining protein MreD